jgi:glycosyltransferase involved in cell wall biosynthesis
MKERLPKVTVLIPSYNHGSYITSRIQSIMNQTYSNLELFVIDDFSTDNSDEIINQLKSEFGFNYIRNQKNSGSPFSSWERICSLGKGEYIWVCESDDVADSNFLEVAVSHFLKSSNLVMFYCNSHIIDEKSQIIGHTNDYFHEIWQEKRWDKEFITDGITEISDFQLRGQTVPNMSSALFKASAFESAFSTFLNKLQLTGDWLFVGDVMKKGDVAFTTQTLNYFRKHEITARERVKSARSQAEFILTKYSLFKDIGKPISKFAPLMKSDVIRFLYEPAKWYEVLLSLFAVSPVKTFNFALLFLLSTIQNPIYLRKFIERFRHAKSWRKNAEAN